jgi:hypothetical protein
MKSIIEILRNIDIENISEKDLESLLPLLGMNNEKMNQMPPHLSDFYGKGLLFWQYPNQFSRYLKKISEYQVSSYLEIGSRWGGTFIITNEILKLKNQNIRSYACDVIKKPENLIEYEKYAKYKYINKSSLELSLEDVDKQVDLILIDGFHGYDVVKEDFQNSLRLKPKLIVLHDIFSDACPDVVKFWNEIKNNFKHFEYIDQYADVEGKYLGIGVLES